MSATLSGTFSAASSGNLRASIEGLLEELGDSAVGSKGQLGRSFAEGFFRRSDEVYLLQRRLETILAQWMDFYSFVAKRGEGEVLVRVFNPTMEEHGYTLQRTVVQTAMRDQPFIFDTLTNQLDAMELGPARCVHPILGIKRDAEGGISRIDPLPQDTSSNESIMHFEVRRVPDEKLAGVERAVRDRVLKVQAMVADFDAMADRARWLAGHLGTFLAEGASQGDYLHATMVQRFFHWLVDENFVFMGHKEYVLEGGVVVPVEESRLGLNRVEHTPAKEGTPFPTDAAEWLSGTKLIYLGKGREEAGIHRPGKTDHVAVRLIDKDTVRILLFTGLYTHKAISEEVGRIPILREKLDYVLRTHASLEGSVLHRRLTQSFRAIPVEFLFSADVSAIEGAIRLVMAAEETQETGVHLLVDDSHRSAFVIVSLPRENYDDEVRQQASRRLMESMGANYMDYRLAFGPSGNVVLQFYLTAAERFTFDDPEEVERTVAAVTQTWQEQVVKLLRSNIGATRAQELLERYFDLLPEEYRHQVEPAEACEDLNMLERARTTGGLQVTVGARAEDSVAGVTRIKLYQHEKIYLTDSTPVLDNFGLRVIDQSSVTIGSAEGQAYYVDSFRVVPGDPSLSLEGQEQRLVQALTAVLQSRGEDDSLNALLVSAGLNWREVDVLRAYIAHGRQLGGSASTAETHSTWRAHPAAAKLLLALFRARFNPALGDAEDGARATLVGKNRKAFVDYLATVQTSSEDRILRGPLNLLDSTLRTNFFRRNGHGELPLAYKVDCSMVEGMVEPRPYREIFVFSDKLQGVHLRGGPVARGGLRWSDRPEDFRTEILGLMDTQMVKNVLIVPVGAKGGFVLKRKYATRGEARAAADLYYESFIRGLLSLTDNVVDGDIVHPPDTVRFDPDDPYLVVAADKGTAHLSDTANRISAEFDFWLGDAFASGGSAGYDHKKYGITAKGAWVCTRRHFREVGVDPEKDVITVAGIGDMGGDVFGNGLLLSKTMKLLAAFNHMHIFLDPDPEPGLSWGERSRLFSLPRSTWEDYDETLMSEGGGIFPRHAKTVPLSPQVQAMLGVEAEELSGDELVHAILLMEADLLWNGGIGTYVKASTETQRDAGDPANDSVRVDAKNLRFRVIGEGGNLGMTQAARVEFARKSGRLNTDAVDNSGGVDMSDHEVNLKILAQDLEASGELDRTGRDELLLSIAEEVSLAVQSNNHDHSQLLSMDVARSVDELDDFRVLLRDLEQSRNLDRKRHQLPSDGELLRRAKNKEGLLRPELCRIEPFVKMEVYEDLLKDGRFFCKYTERWLKEYFPKKVRKLYGKYVRRHQLKAEIAATVITSSLVDAMGSTHFSRMQRLTGRSNTAIALASLIAGDLLGTTALKRALRDVSGVRASVEYTLLRDLERTVADLARWLLHRGVDVYQPQAVIKRFQAGFSEYEASLLKLLTAREKREYNKKIRYMRNRQILRASNERVAGLAWVVRAAEAISLAERHEGMDVVAAGRLLKTIASDLRLNTVSRLATPEDARDGWESRAIARLRSDNAELILDFADAALSGKPLVADGPGGKGAKTPRGLERLVKKRWTEFLAPREGQLAGIVAMADRIADAGARGLAPALVLQSTVKELRTEA
ncbi:MAG: NAD-glutamate dehydrogenase [Deltaproteobacteria bacterium]|nr:NAD-glutamate dehydrogenase [Deltaproteobacteria bacterium]